MQNSSFLHLREVQIHRAVWRGSEIIRLRTIIILNTEFIIFNTEFIIFNVEIATELNVNAAPPALGVIVAKIRIDGCAPSSPEKQWKTVHIKLQNKWKQ